MLFYIYKSANMMLEVSLQFLRSKPSSSLLLEGQAQSLYWWKNKTSNSKWKERQLWNSYLGKWLSWFL